MADQLQQPEDCRGVVVEDAFETALLELIDEALKDASDDRWVFVVDLEHQPRDVRLLVFEKHLVYIQKLLQQRLDEREQLSD